ncbi:galactosyltransferase-related protein [Chitinophaga polysaccharea]|uniref:galactosyltransferase-related protein n=1 Tax=Chitinophaga polysaccharea TaxID=1293035 RepID=UPI00115C03CD|nr:galactosyltransferase-related protein [Chitinophaga polysaccharea]
MIYYISAQPDELYFKWQLEVQLFNFHQHKIPAENIHVLISYNSYKGISPIFKQFAIDHQNKAQFFFYEDTRVDRNYIPSMRPHIIKKHFGACPFLNDANIFYHDSDIIFRKLPDWKELCDGNTWYVSDTSSYLSVEYIKGIGDIVFQEMCEVLNMNRGLISSNSKKAGGAQYVLKRVNYQFWNKVESDCEKLFKHLIDNKERYEDIYCHNIGIDKSSYRPIQDWCADMWAILWNGLHFGFNVEISGELDFCWPTDPLERWNETKILHNSGVTESMSDTYFYKGGFYNTTPYDVPLTHVTSEKCTIKYVEAIRAYQDSEKYDLTDVTFLMLARIDSPDRTENISITTNFLHKHFKTNILLLEADTISALADLPLPPNVKKLFIYDDDIYLHRAKHHNYMIHKADTGIIAIYDVDVIINPPQVVEAVNSIRIGQCSIAYPYDGRVVSIWDADLKKRFHSKLDARMFKPSVSADTSKAYGGAVFIDRSIFIKCGMENEMIYKWGPDDIERAKRMEILGYSNHRVEGPLYHLFHRRVHNSSYTSSDDYEALMKEYIRICKMSTEELSKEVGNWTWTQM